ncbi:MAG: hypothetical protein J6W67_09790 [Lentisphaeria bacterium]|nr:hypothetical protein [Lentisphaeria bacterium]
MFSKIDIKNQSGSRMRGYADISAINAETVSALSGCWQNPPGTICKQGSSTVAFIDGDVFVKCSPAGTGIKRLRRLFQKPRPFLALEMNKVLKELDIPTPEIICAVREFRCGLPVCDYLVTEVLDPQTTCSANCYVMTSEADRSTLLAEGAKILGALHERNIIHGDASTKNFYMIRENGKSSVGVIDFDSSTRASRFSYLFRKETARFISSFLMGCGRESDEDITQTSRIFFENYNAVCSKKYRPEALKKYITDFFASTRRK